MPKKNLKLLQTTTDNYPKCLDKSYPRVYDINNYDTNSFEICGAHTHPGSKLHLYLKRQKPEIPTNPVVSLEQMANLRNDIDQNNIVVSS